MRGMRRLQEEGVIRHVGVSNYPLQRWREAERALGGPVLSNQVRFSLVDRRPERELLPFAQAEGRVVIAYSPLAQGLLSGRYDEQNRPRGQVRRISPLFSRSGLAAAAPLLEAIREVGRAHSASSAQVALAWLVRRPNVLAIPGASSVEQVEQNAAAADLELTDDEDARLTEASDSWEP